MMNIYVFIGGIALWDLVDNFYIFVYVSGVVEYDDFVILVGVVSGGKLVVSCGVDRW